MRTSFHARGRIVERDEEVNSRVEAKKVAKMAFRCGAVIGDFQKYPKFYDYLSRRRSESNTCRVRIFRGNIYIWKGKTKTLITCHPIPDRFVAEMQKINGGNTENEFPQ